MANEIAKLVATITADTKGLEKGLQQSKTSLGGFSAALKQIGPLIGVTFGAASIAMIAKTGLELGRLGADSLRLKTSFAQLATGMGSSSDAILSSLKRASQGAISETDLILAANRAMMLGLGANAQEMGKLLEVASFRARAMGISTTQAFDNIVTGIGRKSPLILDNLGIVGLKMDETTSKAEIMAQVITQGQKMIADAGGMAADAVTSFERMDAKTADLKAKIGELWVKTGVPELAVNFISEGVGGWINTFDAIAAIDAWAAANHTTTMQVLMGTAPQINEVGGVGNEAYGPAFSEEAALAAELNRQREEALRREQLIFEIETSGYQVMTDQVALSATLLNMSEERAESEALAAMNAKLNAEAQQIWADSIKRGSNDAGVAIDGMAERAMRVSDAFNDVGLKVQGVTTELLIATRAARDMAYQVQLASISAMPQEFGGRAGIMTPAMRSAEQLTRSQELAEEFNRVQEEKLTEIARRTGSSDDNIKTINKNVQTMLDKALGIGGNRGASESPAEPINRLAAIANEGEDAGGGTYGRLMREEVARIAQWRPGGQNYESVMRDNANYRAEAASILQDIADYGAENVAGAISKNLGIDLIDWGAAAIAMNELTQMEAMYRGGAQYGFSQMGMATPEGFEGGMQIPISFQPAGFGGAAGGAVSGVSGGLSAIGQAGGNASNAIADMLRTGLGSGEVQQIGTEVGTEIGTAVQAGLSMVSGGAPLAPLVADLTTVTTQIKEFKDIWDGLSSKTLDLLIKIDMSGSPGGNDPGAPSAPYENPAPVGTGERPYGYATGGLVGGGGGSPVPILAHMGEMVLNRGQQMQVAGMMAGGGGGVTINIPGPVFLSDEAAMKKFGRVIQPYIRNATRSTG
jgi:hypothetical protein